MLKNKFKRLIAGALAIVMTLGFANVSYAKKIDTEVIDEKWGKPTYVYGESLNKSDIEKTQKMLGIKNPENVYSIKVTYRDMLDYIGGDPNAHPNMISSVLVQKQDKGKGLEVSIETPENITQITKEQYENASITAGVTDAKIQVGSIKKVTGESALTGIYKAFEANGEKLDRDRMEAGQKELEVVNDISQENKNKDDFSTEKLDNAIIDVKGKLSETKKENNQTPDKDEIRKIVEDAINDSGLGNVVNNIQIDNLVVYFQKYVNTSAIDSEEVKAQLKDLSSKVIKGAEGLYNDAKESGLIDKIVIFFKDLVGAIANLFNN